MADRENFPMWQEDVDKNPRHERLDEDHRVDRLGMRSIEYPSNICHSNKRVQYKGTKWQPEYNQDAEKSMVMHTDSQLY